MKMMKVTSMRACLLAAGFMAAMSLTVAGMPNGAQTPDTLEIYYIDTEGGQATLFVGPTGESLLVESGNAGDRDLGRIIDTLGLAGVDRIDHMWTTHYHGDHMGALLALAERNPIMRF
jgi:glyoxylase-like metal-dependent hydrolase (beta-lactamase superfamily II)